MIRHIARGRQRLATAATALTLSFLLAPAAHASGSSMPWEAPLQSILQSIEGPVAKIIAVIIITMPRPFGSCMPPVRWIVRAR